MTRPVVGLPLLAVLIVATAVLAAGVSSEFVGDTRCKQCHVAAHERWTASPHAKANQALPAATRSDARCVQCHGDANPSVGGVQCESCHGAGKAYAVRYVMKDRELARIVGLVDQSEKICLRCHTDTAPSINPFSYERLWNLITHGLDPAPEPQAAAKK